VTLFSREGRYLATLVDFRPPAPTTPTTWRPRRLQHGRRRGAELLPVCMGLSSPGCRLAVALDHRDVTLQRFRKIIGYSVSPEL